MSSPAKNSSNHSEKACGEASILAFQIYDQCKQKWCGPVGPWISAEKCDCILLETPEESDRFGRYLAPGQPVTLPDRVKKVRLEEGSFSTEKLSATIVRPADPSCECWEVRILATVICSVEFYSDSMRRLPIRLLCGADGEENCLRPGLRVAFTCEKRMFLRGGTGAVTTSGLPEGHGCGTEPHVFAELKADPLKFYALRAEDAADCGEVCDCNYEEPLRYLYADVGFAMMLFLYRIVSMRVASSGISVPEDCRCDLQTPCEQFRQLHFPPDLIPGT